MLLLDEPLNAVDEATAERLTGFLREVRDEPRPPTILHVGHVRSEAEALANVLLRFDGGRVVPG